MFFLFSFIKLSYSKTISLKSPNEKVVLQLSDSNGIEAGSWHLKIEKRTTDSIYQMLTRVYIGLKRNDQDFYKNLQFIKAGKTITVREEYTSLHGKKSLRSNTANEKVFYFENDHNSKMNLIVRAYNDGVVFRYEFPDKNGEHTIKDELTSYAIPDSTNRWLEKFDLSNEGLYSHMKDAAIQHDWCYPALFNTRDGSSWFLIHEADVDRSYCATKLSNYNNKAEYKVTLPSDHEGEGEALPTITLPWKSPWRVIIVGSLADIVESTLVEDVSTPSKIENIEWIKPGAVSWNYWSDNHGTKDYQTVCKFADLAADMNWSYTLLDWEWDQMANGGDLEDALRYIHSIGVKPLMWYNSSMFKWITSTPVDRMKTHENRVEEFTKLNKLGVYGIKVDFFLSEKQYMIDYYLDILEDAAEFEMMVYFHGCLVPRGWARTYPHLMTYEGVRGAEWYNNNTELTTTAPVHNTVLPFTRNVVGSMDYTPVTFTNSQNPHITSYGHELALSVVFESALQHMADRPEGYYNLPDAPKSFLKEIPTVWDDTKLLDGYPGEFVVMARRKGSNWYIGGVSADERSERVQKLNFEFLPENQKYKLLLVADGKHDKEFMTKRLVVDRKSTIEVNLLRRGGFIVYLENIDI